MTRFDGWVRMMDLYNGNGTLGDVARFLGAHGCAQAAVELRNLRPGEEDRVPIKDLEPTEVLDILRHALPFAEFYLTEDNRLRSKMIP
jgi:hypothetical protein